ncbi:MAG: peptidylprolyl isomerase, partial [Polyangiaceae bacterium]|nr:peptidylprolyl isomerase [Polyangiaceae bacterium]
MRLSIRLLAPGLALAASLGGCQCSSGPAPSPSGSAQAAAASATPAPSASGAPAESASAAPPLRVVGASQILVAYKGAELATPAVTRSKDEARKRAQEALDALMAGKGSFEDLAKQYSDDPTKVV